MHKHKKCPQCGAGAKYSTLLRRKDYAYFHCGACGKYSFLALNANVRLLLGALVALCAVAVIFCGIFLGKMLLTAGVIVALFVGFFLLVPFFLDLELQEE